MPGRKIPRKATYLQALVYYDGPQVVVLDSDQNNKMLAVAVSRDGMEYPFFGCEVSEKYFDGYFREKFDFSYTLRQALGGKFFFFDLSSIEDEQVTLVRASQESVVKNALYAVI